MTLQEMHSETLVIANNIRREEARLLPMLMKMKERRGFTELGYTGIFDYVFRYLKFSEEQSSYYRRMAEKAQEVPLLKEKVSDGTLSLSRARRIVKVLNAKNAQEWIDRALTMPQKALERAVAAACPEGEIRERVRPVAKERLELRTGISAQTEAKLKRVQDLRGSSSIEGALEAALDAYLEKHDPIRQAERAAQRKQKPVTPSLGRKVLPAQVRHEVTLRDQAQCTHRYPDGSRCEARRFLQRHHVQPLGKGGFNLAGNLVTLCSAHHRVQHHGELLPFAHSQGASAGRMRSTAGGAGNGR